MNIQLKTLKELEKLCKCESHCDCYEPTPETLRIEAIKWIKEPDEIAKFFDDTTEVGSCINWIKYFFNITNEDLK